MIHVLKEGNKQKKKSLKYYTGFIFFYANIKY